MVIWVFESIFQMLQLVKLLSRRSSENPSQAWDRCASRTRPRSVVASEASSVTLPGLSVARLAAVSAVHRPEVWTSSTSPNLRLLSQTKAKARNGKLRGPRLDQRNGRVVDSRMGSVSRRRKSSLQRHKPRSAQMPQEGQCVLPVLPPRK